jgi:lipoate-protein ligase B
MHGFALNVNSDLAKFNRIIPCGIFHKGVTSMQRILGQEIPLLTVQKALVHSFENVFECKSRWIVKEDLDTLILNLSIQQKELSQNLAAQ